MPVSPSYRAFVLDQLGRVTGGIRARSMFGGVGIYADDLFFALIDDDALYLKVDDTNRPDYISAGMNPFMPFGEEGEVMQYYQLPAELLEGGDDLGVWVRKAIEVARGAQRRKKRR